MLSPARAKRPKEDMLEAPTVAGRAGFVGTALEPVAYIPAQGEGEPATVVAIPTTDFEESAPGGITFDPALLKGVRPAAPRDLLGDYLDKYPASTLETYLSEYKIPLILTAAVVAYLVLRG